MSAEDRMRDRMFPRPKRGKLEILAAVMESIAEGENHVTRIMYKANLAWRVLDDILSELETLRFVRVTLKHGYRELQRDEVTLTPRGLDWLMRYRDIQLRLLPEETIVWHGEVKS